MSERVNDDINLIVKELAQEIERHQRVLEKLAPLVEEIIKKMDKDFRIHVDNFLCIYRILMMLAQNSQDISNSDRAAFKAELEELHAELEKIKAESGSSESSGALDKIGKIQTLLATALQLVAKYFGL